MSRWCNVHHGQNETCHRRSYSFYSVRNKNAPNTGKSLLHTIYRSQGTLVACATRPVRAKFIDAYRRYKHNFVQPNVSVVVYLDVIKFLVGITRMGNVEMYSLKNAGLSRRLFSVSLQYLFSITLCSYWKTINWLHHPCVIFECHI